MIRAFIILLSTFVCYKLGKLSYVQNFPLLRLNT